MMDTTLPASVTALQRAAIFVILACPQHDWPAALNRLCRNHELVEAVWGLEFADLQTKDIGLEFKQRFADILESRELQEAVFDNTKRVWNVGDADDHIDTI